MDAFNYGVGMMNNGTVGMEQYPNESSIMCNPEMFGMQQAGGYTNMAQKMPTNGYTSAAQLNMDPCVLLNYKFLPEEVQFLEFLIYNIPRMPSINVLTTEFGLSYDQARRIRYAYDICIGKVTIENEEDLCKHLKKMFASVKKIGIQDLAVSRISKVPRKAMIAGIPKGPFELYNSNRYEKAIDRMYEVVDVTSSRIIMQTTRKPILRTGEPRFIEGIIEIKELSQDKKTVTIAVDKKHAKLCNRFIVVASLRRPEFHHGMAEIICLEGSKVYVYAHTMGTKDTISYNMGTQRVYDYGFLPRDIDPKLWNAFTVLYQQLQGVTYKYNPANQDFVVLSQEEDRNKEEDILDVIEE